MITIYVRGKRKGKYTKRRDALGVRGFVAYFFFFFKKKMTKARANVDPRLILLSRNALHCHLFHSICPFHYDTPWFVTEDQKTRIQGTELNLFL